MKSSEVLKILKISRVTLWKYVKSGKIRVKTEPNGYYKYNDNDVYALAGIEDQRLNVIYARNQMDNNLAFLNAKGISVDKIYSDIKSGMTLDRPGFMQLLSDVMDYKIKAV
ncbi:MerR family transcriptional regulator, partial [Helicobacter suis]|uniref:MerR family transcriptional regulator n=1 Tax=Helicobacter suis TaxID=104628 RepID=UPI0013D0B199